MTSTRRPGIAGRTAVARGALAPLAIMVLVPLLLTGCLVQPRRAIPLGSMVQLSSVDGGQVVTQTEPGHEGPVELRYDHNEEIGMGFTVTVDPGPSLVLTGARLYTTEPTWATTLSATVSGRPLPAEIAGGEHATINLRVQPNNCRYELERDPPTISALVVDLVNAGRRETWRVPVDRHLVIRGPVTVGCSA